MQQYILSSEVQGSRSEKLQSSIYCILLGTQKNYNKSDFKSLMTCVAPPLISI